MNNMLTRDVVAQQVPQFVQPFLKDKEICKEGGGFVDDVAESNATENCFAYQKSC